MAEAVDPRWSWRETFGQMAKALADGRADCTRRKVGCIIFNPKNGDYIESGYNGAPRGEPGCLSAGACPRGKHFSIPDACRSGKHMGHATFFKCACGTPYWPCPEAVEPGSSYDTGPGMCIAIHAEANCLVRAGKAARFMSMVITHEPCGGCVKLLKAAGLWHVYWPDGEFNWEPQMPRSTVCLD
jgi:dCMP deaminase